MAHVSVVRRDGAWVAALAGGSALALAAMVAFPEDCLIGTSAGFLAAAPGFVVGLPAGLLAHLHGPKPVAWRFSLLLLVALLARPAAAVCVWAMYGDGAGFWAWWDDILQSIDLVEVRTFAGVETSRTPIHDGGWRWAAQQTGVFVALAAIGGALGLLGGHCPRCLLRHRLRYLGVHALTVGDREISPQEARAQIEAWVHAPGPLRPGPSNAVAEILRADCPHCGRVGVEATVRLATMKAYREPRFDVPADVAGRLPTQPAPAA